MAIKKEKSTSSEKETTRLILLDVHAIIHRAYHALPDFTSAKGEPTGALYGLSTMLIKIIRELSPSHLIACYDLPKPTFRHEVYKQYKAGRPKTDSELIEQIKRSRDVFKAFGISIYEQETFEADDLIGTLAEQAKKKSGVKTIIASGDMDTLQLVDGKRVTVYTLKKGISDTIIYDEEKVHERFGFSPHLLPDYKGLRGDPSDNIIGIKGIGEKTATTLIKEFGTLENIYKALKKNKEAFKKIGITERIITLLEEGKEEALFSKVLGSVRKDAPVTLELPEKKWELLSHKETITNLFNELGFRSLITRLSELAPEKEKEEKISKEIVSEEDIERVAIALWVLDSSITNASLDDILQWANTKSFAKAKEVILKKLSEEKKLEKVYTEIELPLTPVLKKAEIRGVLIDISFLKKLSNTYHKNLTILQEDIWKLAGGEFNINSPKQLSEILFDKILLKRSGIKKTEGGARSTKASELEKLVGTHPIIEKLIRYRELQKLLSTYIDNIPDMLGPDNRLHTHYVQHGTTTGRFASQNPNLQNLPIKSDLGKEVRKAFIGDVGFSLLSFDYSQIELRIAALLSGDKKLIEMFKKGIDVHTGTASEVFGVPFDKVDHTMRRAAKVINFGIIYGMGVNALRQNLGTSREEAQKFYTTYFEKFTGLANYLEDIKRDAVKKGYTETYFGRRRYFPGLRSPLPYIRAQEERMAVNAPFQGTSADIIKIAMSRAEEKLSKANLLDSVFITIQIHDELVYEFKKDVVEKAARLIKEVMESVWNEAVPLVIDVSEGDNFGELKRLTF